MRYPIGCGGKVRYPDERSAKAAVKYLKKQGTGKVFEVYRCRHCGELHVGGKRVAVETNERLGASK